MARKHHRSPINGALPILLTVAVIATIYLFVKARDAQPAFEPPTTTIDSLLVVKVPQEVGQTCTPLNYKGFNVLFDNSRHIPAYVAWDVTPDKARGTLKRSDNFQPDTNVSSCATLADYKGSGYSRGHMAPSADMKWDAEAMDHCFLLTNMCPQKAELNNGAWKSLEDATRKHALAGDTMIVICGPVLTDRMPRTIGKSNVAVPERFFKVLLTPFSNPPQAIGFIMPNSQVEGGMQQAAVSVDEVERITGYDFFSALPDDIENQIEAECNFHCWNRTKHKKK